MITSPGPACVTSAVFVTERSARLVAPVAVLVLFDGSRSTSAPWIAAVFVIEEALAAIVPVSLIVTVPPTPRLPIEQLRSDPEIEHEAPPSSATVAPCISGGIESCTVTPVAGEGPLFLATIV